MECEMFLMPSLKKDVNKPLFRRVRQSGHIFDFNVMLEELLTFLERNAKDSSFLIAESTFFLILF